MGKNEGVRVKQCLVWLFCALVLVPGLLRAEEVEAGRFADLVLKVLAYSRNLDRYVDGEIRILVLCAPGSAKRAQQLLGAFSERSSMTVLGYRFRAESKTLTGGEDVSAALSGKRTTCAVFLDGLEPDLPQLAEATRRLKILSVTDQKAYVGEASLGFVAEENRIAIYRSDQALQSEGMILSSEFLKLTQLLAQK